MRNVRVGMEVRFFKWVVETHVVHRALLRSWTVTGKAALSYWNESSINVANIENIETYGSVEADLYEKDYWNILFFGRSHDQSKPYVNTPKPSVGDCVWLWNWDAVHEEHRVHPAIVRTVGPGTPPKIGVFFIHRQTAARTPVNGVEPFSEQSFPTENNYWARRRLVV